MKAAKPYTTPKLETLSLRETRDIDLGIGIHIPGIGGGGVGS